jgi:hypothetical protein
MTHPTFVTEQGFTALDLPVTDGGTVAETQLDAWPSRGVGAQAS